LWRHLYYLSFIQDVTSPFNSLRVIIWPPNFERCPYLNVIIFSTVWSKGASLSKYLWACLYYQSIQSISVNLFLSDSLIRMSIKGFGFQWTWPRRSGVYHYTLSSHSGGVRLQQWCNSDNFVADSIGSRVVQYLAGGPPFNTVMIRFSSKEIFKLSYCPETDFGTELTNFDKIDCFLFGTGYYFTFFPIVKYGVPYVWE